MNPDEYSNLERVEKEHWFYAGKREIVKFWLNQTGVLNKKNRLLDCGAGSGHFAVSLVGDMDIRAMDDHEEALDLMRRRLPPHCVIEGSCERIPLADNSLDAVTALDVLEHVEKDRRSVAELVRVMRPGGVCIITVPALMCLWSDWDVALQHYRRYSRNSLMRLFNDLPVNIERCMYINVLPFPIVWTVRRLRRWGLFKDTRLEDIVPTYYVNRLLKSTFVRTATSTLSFPFGVGLLLVARKCK
jgi:SAM-dependent methyltransferase